MVVQKPLYADFLSFVFAAAIHHSLLSREVCQNNEKRNLIAIWVRAGTFNRRRGKTLSSLDIFSISRDISSPTGLRGGLLDAFNDRKNQSQDILTAEMEARCNITEDDPNNIAIDHYGIGSQATDGTSTHENLGEPVADTEEDNSDGSVSDEDLKDLARHGLPSACIFVAKYIPTVCSPAWPVLGSDFE